MGGGLERLSGWIFVMVLVLSGCSSVLNNSTETVALDYFISSLEGLDNAETSVGPDDLMAFADTMSDVKKNSLSSFVTSDVVIMLGSSEVNVYRHKDPETGDNSLFDINGNRLGQYLLRNPVPEGRRTSGFGMRYHPVLKFSRMHSGVDWAANSGTPIYAAAGGVVRFAGYHGGDGRRTVINHGYGYETSYSHQSKFAEGIKVDVTVQQGELIGYVGRSGLTTGSHLHYEVSVDGQKVDPMKVRFIIDGKLTGPALVQFKKNINVD